MAIRIGILGYGNLGRGIECVVKQNDDMELAAVFTRRNPNEVKSTKSVQQQASVPHNLRNFIWQSDSFLGLAIQTPSSLGDRDTTMKFLLQYLLNIFNSLFTIHSLYDLSAPRSSCFEIAQHLFHSFLLNH